MTRAKFRHHDSDDDWIGTYSDWCRLHDHQSSAEDLRQAYLADRRSRQIEVMGRHPMSGTWITAWAEFWSGWIVLAEVITAAWKGMARQ